MKIKPYILQLAITLLCLVAVIFAVACTDNILADLYACLVCVFGLITIKSINNEE